VRFDEVRFQQNCTLVTRYRFFYLALRLQRVAKVAMCRGEVRFSRKRLLKAFCRLLIPILRSERHAEIYARLNKIGLYCQSTLKARHRLLDHAAPREGCAEVRMGRGVVRVECECASIARNRLVHPSLPMMAQGVRQKLTPVLERRAPWDNGCRIRGLMRGQVGKVRGDLLKHARPIAGGRLAIESQGRIPRAVRPIQHPAPVGRERQQSPHRLPQGPGQVHCRRVNRDHEIQAGHCRGRVREVAELRPKINQPTGKAAGRDLLGCHALLQAEEANPANRKHRRQRGQAQRAVAVVLVGRAPGPNQTHLQARSRADALPKGRDEGWVGSQIWHLVRDRLEPGAQQMHQTEQRCVRGHTRRRLRPGRHLIDARGRRKQSHQRPRALEDDAAAARARKGCITNELDRIANALFCP